MIIPVLFMIGNLIAAVLYFLENHGFDYSKEFTLTKVWFFFGYIILVILLIFTLTSYAGDKAEMFTIAEKISVVEQANKERIESVLPILQKYPELEKELISNINPNAFAILGDVYPNLKANESYKQQAALVSENIKKIESLKLEEVDLKKNLYFRQYFLWFLN